MHFLCLSLTQKENWCFSNVPNTSIIPQDYGQTCCSHQRDGETNIQAGKRRLQEEMGFSTELKEVTSFIYKAPFDNGLTEHEFDHVLLGYYEDDPVINLDEVSSWKWMSLEEVKYDIDQNPDRYTIWFVIIFANNYKKIKPD